MNEVATPSAIDYWVFFAYIAVSLLLGNRGRARWRGGIRKIIFSATSRCPGTSSAR